MSLPLFYAEPDSIDSSEGFVVISGADARHLAASLRARKGERLDVADGRGWIYRTAVDSVGPDAVRAVIASASFVEPKEPSVVLFQSISRPARIDEAVARAAESGVSRFVPFRAPRSDAASSRIATGRMERLERVALEASKVARRSIPLSVGEPAPWPPAGEMTCLGLCLTLWEGDAPPLMDVLPEIAPASVGVFAGPEGGFSEEDVETLQRSGALPASLGSLVLRTESAGAFATALIRYHYKIL